MSTRGFTLVAAVAVVVLATALPAAADEDWERLLRRATDAAATTPYVGRALWVSYGGERPRTTSVTLRADGRGTLLIGAPERYPVRVGVEDSDRVRHDEGWSVPLPGAALGDVDEALAALAEKYDAKVVGQEAVAGRPARVLEVRMRGGAMVRERLWFDEATGLVLKRETYAGDGTLLRRGYFVELNLDTQMSGRLPSAEAEAEPEHEATPVSQRGIAALRKAGWRVPEELPGGYQAAAVYAVVHPTSQPLQIVYHDGLYTVSLFQQPGRPDWSSLPEGAVSVDELPWDGYHWPGTVPSRLVWEAEGWTFSLVGDAPPGDLHAIAAAVPEPDEPGLWERLRRGVSRLWARMALWE